MVLHVYAHRISVGVGERVKKNNLLSDATIPHTDIEYHTKQCSEHRFQKCPILKLHIDARAFKR